MSEIKNITRVEYKIFGFKVQDEFLSASNSEGSDINYYIQVPENYQNSLSEFFTILVNLKEEETIIWNNIYHRTQSEISSFTTHQKYEHKIIYNLSKTELNNFIVLFNLFAAAKNIRKAEAFRLNAYHNEGILAISYIKQSEQFLSINFYRVTRSRATNLYSFHSLKSSGQFNPTHIGRAHRALHWLDMMEFKKLGVDFYDFCGWYGGKENEKLLSINKFKEQFSNHIVKEYSGVIYKNKMLQFLKNLKSGG